MFIFNVGIARQHLLCRKHQISVLFFDDSGGTRTSICKSSVLVSDFGCPTVCVSLMNEVLRNHKCDSMYVDPLGCAKWPNGVMTDFSLQSLVVLFDAS